MLPRPPSCSNLSRPDLHSVSSSLFFFFTASHPLFISIFLCIPPLLFLSLSLALCLPFCLACLDFCAEIIKPRKSLQVCSNSKDIRIHAHTQTRCPRMETTNKREWVSTCDDNRPPVLHRLPCGVANYLLSKFVKEYI